MRPSGGSHWRQAGGVEAEEVVAGVAPIVDVGAHVQLREAREPGQRRGAPHAEAGYHEVGHTEPGLALQQVSTPQLARSTVEKRDVSPVGLRVEATKCVVRA